MSCSVILAPICCKAFLQQFHCNSGFQLLYVCKGPSFEVTPSILAGIMNGLNVITETFTGNIAEATLLRQTSKLKCSFQMVWRRQWQWQGKLISTAEKFPTSNPRCYPLRTCLCSTTLLGNPPSKFSVLFHTIKNLVVSLLALKIGVTQVCYV